MPGTLRRDLCDSLACQRQCRLCLAATWRKGGRMAMSADDVASLESGNRGIPSVMARKQPKRNFVTRMRSAVTGRFVKSSQAKRSPRTTVTERIPIGRRRKAKKR